MTVEILEKIYGHHHPDYQADAAEAATRPNRFVGQKWDRNTVNKRGRTSANSTKIAVVSGSAK
jgi:hypothetical protein